MEQTCTALLDAEIQEYRRIQDGTGKYRRIRASATRHACAGPLVRRWVRVPTAALGHVHGRPGQADERLGLLPRLAEAGCLRRLSLASGKAGPVARPRDAYRSEEGLREREGGGLWRAVKGGGRGAMEAGVVGWGLRVRVGGGHSAAVAFTCACNPRPSGPAAIDRTLAVRSTGICSALASRGVHAHARTSAMISEPARRSSVRASGSSAGSSLAPSPSRSSFSGWKRPRSAKGPTRRGADVGASGDAACDIASKQNASVSDDRIADRSPRGGCRLDHGCINGAGCGLLLGERNPPPIFFLHTRTLPACHSLRSRSRFTMPLLVPAVRTYHLKHIPRVDRAFKCSLNSLSLGR